MSITNEERGIGTSQILTSLEEAGAFTNEQRGTGVSQQITESNTTPNQLVRSGQRTRASERRRELDFSSTSVQTLCFAPSELYHFSFARDFGDIVEVFLAYYIYKHNSFLNSTNCYRDFPFAGSIDRELVNFLQQYHPHISSMDSRMREVASRPDPENDGKPQGFPRPDLLIHTHDKKIFYEIKPDSNNGRYAGKKKMNKIERIYNGELGLGYRKGGRSEIRIPVDIPLINFTLNNNIPVNIHFTFRLSVEGVILYKICIETNWPVILSFVLMEELLRQILLNTRRIIQQNIEFVEELSERMLPILSTLSQAVYLIASFITIRYVAPIASALLMRLMAGILVGSSIIFLGSINDKLGLEPSQA